MFSCYYKYNGDQVISNLECPRAKQLLVLGRGIERVSAGELAGSVQPHSPNSRHSYERAAASARYALEYPDVEIIVFSGSYSFALPFRSRPKGHSEAAAMHGVALRHGLTEAQQRNPKLQVVTDTKSRSTYENLLNSYVYFNVDQPIGLVTHDDHFKRARDIGSFVLPGAVFEHVRADTLPLEQEPAVESREQLAERIYSVAMFGVGAGDIQTIRQRDSLVRYGLNCALGLEAIKHVLIDELAAPLLARV